MTNATKVPADQRIRTLKRRLVSFDEELFLDGEAWRELEVILETNGGC